MRGADHFRPARGVILLPGSPPAEPLIPHIYKTEERKVGEVMLTPAPPPNKRGQNIIGLLSRFDRDGQYSAQ